MSDKEAILASILADPESDAPRLVYADCLEENHGEADCPKCRTNYTVGGKSIRLTRCGECSGTGRVSNRYAERAEFIRVQIKLATTPETIERTGLARRERELFDRHRAEWFPDAVEVVLASSLRTFPGRRENFKLRHYPILRLRSWMTIGFTNVRCRNRRSRSSSPRSRSRCSKFSTRSTTIFRSTVARPRRKTSARN